MFKRLKKSVIDKNNLLLINVSKKRVNKTPSKIVFPNRSNLTFANIIVNMNSTPSFKNIDSWNNSYFKTELSNNSFSNKYSKNSIIDISKNTIETKDENSELLILGKETRNNMENSATNNYTYEIYTTSGEKIEDLSVCEYSNIEISYSVSNLDLINYEEAILLSEQGYDIYDL